MNLFYLDEDLDKNVEYHVNTHVVKMPTEATQMLTTAIWVDHLLGYVPRALTKEELGVLNEFKAAQPPIEERTFTRFLPTHPNHPCSIWVRSSLGNFHWTFEYCDALNSEWCHRWDHTINHKSYDAAIKLPDPQKMPDQGITVRPVCVPEDCFSDDVVEAYRLYYMAHKADWAVWKKRQYPPWWDLNFVEYMNKDPHEAYIATTFAPPNRTKPHGQERFLYVNQGS